MRKRGCPTASRWQGLTSDPAKDGALEQLAVVLAEIAETPPVPGSEGNSASGEALKTHPRRSLSPAPRSERKGGRSTRGRREN